MKISYPHELLCRCLKELSPISWQEPNGISPGNPWLRHFSSDRRRPSESLEYGNTHSTPYHPHGNRKSAYAERESISWLRRPL